MSEKVEKMLELTPKQQKFVDIFIEKGHLQTAKQCALDAGYSESTATVTASALQNPKYYPHVVEELERRRAELARRYSISYKSHIQKLAELRDSAEKAGNFTGAIAAEKYRGMAAGLYVDRKEVMHGTIDSMSVGEVEEKLNELRKKLSMPETLFRRPLNYSQAPLSVIPRPLAKNIPCVPLAPDPSPRAGSSSC
jgi:phage terminase small subunit